MSCQFHFRLLYSNLDDSKKFSKESVEEIALKNFGRSCYCSFTDEAEKAKRFAEIGVPCFLRHEITKKVKSYGGKCEYDVSEQVEDPLPVWIETETGHRYYEMSDYEFLSDFNDLYEHYGLTGQGKNECVEISKKEARQIIQVIDYIFLRKYDRDFERIFLDDNPFFSVLEDVYPKFSRRFQKAKPKKDESNKTIIILKEKKSEYSNEVIDDEEDSYYNDEEDSSEWESEGCWTLERLKTVMENFLHQTTEYEYSDKKHEVKLVYFLSI